MIFQATLEISLSAITDNFQRLASRLSSGSCAGVVKADAYGMGADKVARALFQTGCRQFFVATLEEGIALRKGGFSKGAIYIINSFAKGEEKIFAQFNLLPVLNTLKQLEYWGKVKSATHTSILHIDTGMRRLGLTQKDVLKLAPKPDLIEKAGVTHYMTHLACADIPSRSMNQEQLAEVKSFLTILPKRKMSFANSSGIYLGKDYHYDLSRPGCALYGINPTPHTKNPMRGVARLSAPILQIRELEKRQSVGYGATHIGKKGDLIATVALGYADGWLRCLSNKAHAYIGKEKCPIIGRVSMDSVMVDITHIPPAKITATTRAEFIGKHQSVDAVADAAGTIGYEIFTRLGARVKRVYTDDGQF
jgi:alanine racemase